MRLKWLTDSNKLGVLCDVSDKKYLIGCTNAKNQEESNNSLRNDFEMFQTSLYECQHAYKPNSFNQEYIVKRFVYKLVFFKMLNL